MTAVPAIRKQQIIFMGAIGRANGLWGGQSWLHSRLAGGYRGGEGWLRPHIPGVIHIPPPHEGISEAPGEELARAANVEYSCCRCFFPQDGQPDSIASSVRRTSFSNLFPQDSQLYS
jgi:hypothetical protein